jgi:hypothetical protein
MDEQSKRLVKTFSLVKQNFMLVALMKQKIPTPLVMLPVAFSCCKSHHPCQPFVSHWLQFFSETTSQNDL